VSRTGKAEAAERNTTKGLNLGLPVVTGDDDQFFNFMFPNGI
jgi:hypothetical protein